MNKIVEPGLYDMPDADYQSDPCEEISLRSSLAWVLADPKRTPAHAWWECPRLNPAFEREEKRHFNIGSACHALLFGRGKELVGVDGFDYLRNEDDDGPKAKVKRDVRDRAYLEGKIPLLRQEWAQVQDMAKAAKRQINAMIAAGTIEANPFGEKFSEKVIVWRDARTNVLCRAALDGLHLENDFLGEYKTDGESASPADFPWKARRLGYFFRLAFYRRGLEALQLSHSPTIRIFVQETKPPYLMASYLVDDELIALEDQRVHRALTIWRRCLETNHWPGYSVEGYDATLTERERQQEQAPQQSSAKTAHVMSEEMPDEIYSPVKLAPRRKR